MYGLLGFLVFCFISPHLNILLYTQCRSFKRYSYLSYVDFENVHEIRYVFGLFLWNLSYTVLNVRVFHLNLTLSFVFLQRVCYQFVHLRRKSVSISVLLLWFVLNNLFVLCNLIKGLTLFSNDFFLF